MEQSLITYIESTGATQDVILEAMKNYLSRQSGFKDPTSLVAKYKTDQDSIQFIDFGLDRLTNPRILESTALEILSFAWQDESERKEVELAFQVAKSKLPVLDPAIIQMIALYGILYMGWLVITKGKSKAIVRVERRPDGTLIEETTTIFAASPLESLEKINPLSIFHKKNE